MNRREFVQTLGLGMVTGLTINPSLQAQSTTSRLPNIIYILADDLGYGDLGCYGQQKIKTPNLDQMARDGMRFTNHYAGSTVCAPSRCSLMTGYHTGHTFIRGNKEIQPEGQYPIPGETKTLAKLMKQAGYVTGCIGKWGLGSPGSEGDPLKQGFDFFYGYNCQRHAHSYYPEYLWRNDRKVSLKGNENGQKNTYSHDLLAREALNFMLANSNRPFFLYLPFTIPHAEIQVPEDSYRDYEGAFPEKPFINKSGGGYDTQMNPRATMAGMITRMDRDIGKIFDLLKRLDLDENTLVIFTSDNGPHKEGGIGEVDFFASNGPFKGAKRDLYEGGIRVPMIARWPGTIKAGTVSDYVSAFWDVLPTLAELGGIEAPAGIDGISFLPTLMGKSQPGHPYLYWEFHEMGGRQAVRMDNWKGIRQDVFSKPESPIELYDLKDDPGETENVAADHPQVVQKIDRIMAEAHVESSIFPFRKK